MPYLQYFDSVADAMFTILSLSEFLEAIAYCLGDIVFCFWMAVAFDVCSDYFFLLLECAFSFHAKKKQTGFWDTFSPAIETSDGVGVFRTAERWRALLRVEIAALEGDLREELGNLANATPYKTKFEKTSCRNVLGTERTVVTVKKHEEERCDFFKNDFYDPILVREFEVVDAGVTRWCAIGRKGVPQRQNKKHLWELIREESFVPQSSFPARLPIFAIFFYRLIGSIHARESWGINSFNSDHKSITEASLLKTVAL